MDISRVQPRRGGARYPTGRRTVPDILPQKSFVEFNARLVQKINIFILKRFPFVMRFLIPNILGNGLTPALADGKCPIPILPAKFLHSYDLMHPF